MPTTTQTTKKRKRIKPVAAPKKRKKVKSVAASKKKSKKTKPAAPKEKLPTIKKYSLALSRRVVELWLGINKVKQMNITDLDTFLNSIIKGEVALFPAGLNQSETIQMLKTYIRARTNALSAKKSRTKRKKYISTLEDKVKELTNLNKYCTSLGFTNGDGDGGGLRTTEKLDADPDYIDPTDDGDEDIISENDITDSDDSDADTSDDGIDIQEILFHELKQCIDKNTKEVKKHILALYRRNKVLKLRLRIVEKELKMIQSQKLTANNPPPSLPPSSQDQEQFYHNPRCVKLTEDEMWWSSMMFPAGNLAYM